ncbi:hypothetical protein LZ30DRAFT_747433 [Colletotrichum cereale]|nr:hypothetical protein LZ30DRAFT_747433 [Colletotrichum cereale]
MRCRPDEPSNVHGCPVYGGLRWNVPLTQLDPANDGGLVRRKLGDRGHQLSQRAPTRTLWLFEDAEARIVCGAGPSSAHQLAGTRTTQSTVRGADGVAGSSIAIPIPYTPEAPMSA